MNESVELIQTVNVYEANNKKLKKRTNPTELTSYKTSCTHPFIVIENIV